MVGHTFLFHIETKIFTPVKFPYHKKTHKLPYLKNKRSYPKIFFMKKWLSGGFLDFMFPRNKNIFILKGGHCSDFCIIWEICDCHFLLNFFWKFFSSLKILYKLSKKLKDPARCMMKNWFSNHSNKYSVVTLVITFLKDPPRSHI